LEKRSAKNFMARGHFRRKFAPRFSRDVSLKYGNLRGADEDLEPLWKMMNLKFGPRHRRSPNWSKPAIARGAQIAGIVAGFAMMMKEYLYEDGNRTSISS